MTDEEKRQAIEQYVLNQINNDFTDSEGVQSIPLDVQFAIDKLYNMELDGELGVNSKTEGGISVTFENGIPQMVIDIIHKHRKMKW